MKQVTIIGGGKIGEMIIDMLAESGDYAVTVIDASQAQLDRLPCRGLRLDIADEAALAEALRGQFAVLFAAPFRFVGGVARAAKAAGAHYLDLTEDVAGTRLVKPSESVNMIDGGSMLSAPSRFVADEPSLDEALDALTGVQIIGLDTETFWNPSTRKNQVSLVQIFAGAGEVFVVDALALGVERLRPLVEADVPVMTAHNARFDQGVLAGAGLQPAGLVDTLQMARMSLRLQSYSLASVVEHLFGAPLDKTLRTSNWKRRPLSKAQVSYAALDAIMTLRVYEELKTRLEAEGRFESVLRASTLGAFTSRPPRIKRPTVELSPPLTPEEKEIVKALKKWRLERSFSQRVPAYMICPDRTLEHLARVRPETLDALGGVYGLGESKISKFGEDLLNALRGACTK